MTAPDKIGGCCFVGILVQAEAVKIAPVNIVVAIDAAESRRLQIRRAVSAFAVLVGCVLWYVVLAKLGASAEGLPWYLTCGFIAVLCAHAVVRPMASQFVFSGFGRGAREPLSLLETWAIAYAATSLALFAWVAIHAKLPQQVPPRVVHVVDIQLESTKDYADRQSPMPGSQEQEELHKRRSDNTTSQGSFDAHKAASVTKVEKPALPKREEKQQVQTPPPKPTASPLTTPIPMIVRTAPTKQEPAKQIVLEEVQPPELVEMIENEGEADAAKVFENGGSSAGGKGAANELSTYIKQLHKRIKAAWAPPRGQSREATILFRIRKHGRLAFMKLTRSSGDPETDEAAMKAVTQAVNARKLPEDYSMPYLDVQYTFRYAVDELKEVNVRVLD